MWKRFIQILKPRTVRGIFFLMKCCHGKNGALFNFWMFYRKTEYVFVGQNGR